MIEVNPDAKPKEIRYEVTCVVAYYHVVVDGKRHPEEYKFSGGPLLGLVPMNEQVSLGITLNHEKDRRVG
jgi:hypothetical protein